MRRWLRNTGALGVLSSLALPLMAEPIHVGFGPHRPPYVFENQPKGLEFELFMAAAQRGGLTVEAHFGPTARLKMMLDEQKLDALSSMFLEHDLISHFSAPYVQYQDMAVALAARNLTINSIADLSGYSVSTFKDARRLLGAEFAAMAARNPAYREEPRQLNRNLLLYSGRIDVVVADPLIIDYFNTEVADRVDVHQPLRWYAIFTPVNYRAAFSSVQQRDRFDRGLVMIRTDGTYARIEGRYRKPLPPASGKVAE